ncbi:MAG: mandelate racemase/muconate lactonizing enzyme family protein [Saprospiraceae bacterium]|nr:mandelate racemase/muconate lactonizing enzyme family protein [Saprospiraceae bacterium]
MSVVRIEHFHFYEVMVPARPEAIASTSIAKPLHKLPVGGRSGWSVQFDELPKLIVRLELSDGTVGWGEFYRSHNEKLVRDIAENLLETPLMDLSLQRLPIPYCREYDGFECAIWDAFARHHEMRVVDLLGGPVRDAVAISAWSSHRELAEIKPLANGFALQGHRYLKFKCDLEDDVVEWCRHIAEVAPDMEVILDPNERWETAGDTRKRLDGLSEIGNLLCLEDPIPRWKLNEFAALRQYSSIPIALHVSLPYVQHGQRVKDAIQAIECNAVDGFNFNGGLARFKQLDHIADAAHLPCWHGSEVDLGILEAAYIHASAAALSCTWPGDIFGRLIREHDLLETPLDLRPPYAYLPDGLGLGVAPDMIAIKHYMISEFDIKTD